MITKIDDLEKQTTLAIPLFSRKCAEFEEWCKYPAKRAQGREEVVWGLLNDLNIEMGLDEQLDQIGKVLLEPRNSRSSDEYRVILSGRWATLKGSGSPEDLMDICELLLFANRAVWYGFEDHGEILNLLIVEVEKVFSFTELPYILTELTRSKRGGQGIRVIVVEVDDIFLIPDTNNFDEYHLIPESDSDSVTIPFSLNEIY